MIFIDLSTNFDIFIIANFPVKINICGGNFMDKGTNLKIIELAVIALTLVAAGFLAGYFTGRSKTDKSITVSVSEQIKTPEETAEERTLVLPEAAKVNINTADQATLETLPNVGEVLAVRIIKYRTENGRFERPEDLKNVYGIGDSKYEMLKDYITVD